MAAGVVFMQWDSYAGGAGGPAFFAQEPLTFNSRQERLHRLAPGDRLWLVSRCPDDGQYYFVAALLVTQLVRNPPGSERATLFGEYAIVADRSGSRDLGRSGSGSSFGLRWRATIRGMLRERRCWNA